MKHARGAAIQKRSNHFAHAHEALVYVSPWISGYYWVTRACIIYGITYNSVPIIQDCIYVILYVRIMLYIFIVRAVQLSQANWGIN